MISPGAVLQRRQMLLLAASSLACTPYPAWSAQSLKVSAFGAVGDGVADDTAAVQRALDQLAASGGELVFDSFSYSVGPLVLFSARNVRILGNAGTLVRRFPVTDQSYANTLEVLGCDGVYIQGLQFDGNNRRLKPFEGNCHNLAIHGSARIELVDLHSSYSLCDGLYISTWSDTRHGYAHSGFLNSSDITARNCVSTYNFRQGLSVISCDGFSDINGNYSFTGKAPCGSTPPAAGVDLENNNAAPWIPRRCNFFGTVLSDNVGAGMSIAPDAREVALSHVTVSGNGGFGIVNQGGGVRLQDVKIINSAAARRPSIRAGLMLDGPSSDTVVRKVTVSGSMMGAVLINNVARADIQSLEISNSELFGLWVVTDKPGQKSAVALDNIRISAIYTGVASAESAYAAIINKNDSTITASGITLDGSHSDSSRMLVPTPLDTNAGADSELRRAITLTGFPR
jgi:hypothetical protein